MSRGPARLVDTRTVLVALGGPPDAGLAERFFGATIVVGEAGVPSLAGKSVYLAGDLSRAGELDLAPAARVVAIRELSRNHEAAGLPIVGLGRVPVRVHGLGVYYPRFFEPADDHFGRVCREHAFQSLTESAKPARAHRKGVYLTPVSREADGLHFHLLRCSTNLAGPTLDFGPTDREIVDAVNREADLVFEDHARLNHVLAQVYPNTAATPGQKETKARISAHADKTKDMPVDGVMAFCTFYDRLGRLTPSSTDPFDLGHKGKSGLTRLHFRRKEQAGDASLPAELSLTLYPGSVFLVPLSTNRLYTHEIQASILNAGYLPTRLGYVVRCSKTRAVHRDGRTLLAKGGAWVPLAPPTPEGLAELRRLYAEENRTDAVIDYGDRFDFSMNEGDYLAPGCHDG